MAALSVRRTPLWISVLLLLIFIQMVTSLVLFGGVFILSKETLISPFLFCLIRQHGELSCHNGHRVPVSGADSETKRNVLTAVVTLSLYAPLVLVAFALLSMLFAAYAKDRATLWCSMACQAASSLLLLTGVVAFLLLNQLHVSWEHMTPWFYVCVGVQVQLVIVTALTHVSGKRLTPDWIHPNEKSPSPCYQKGDLK